MVQLSLLWIGMGVLVGLLACAARLGPGKLPQYTNHKLLSLHSVPVPVIAMLCGGGMALAGGWLGVLLVGQFLATWMALWISIVAVVVGLWAIKKHLSCSPKVYM